MTSEFFVSVSKSLEYYVVKASRIIGESQSQTVTKAITVGLLNLSTDPKIAGWTLAGRGEYIISVPMRLEADISRISKSLGKWEFQIVAMALRIGLDCLIKTPNRFKHIVTEKEKSATTSPLKAFRQKPIAPPKVEQPQEKPLATDQGRAAVEDLEVKNENDTGVDVSSVQIKTGVSKLEIRLPKNYLHRYFCKVCDEPIDVPHFDYLALKESTASGERLQCNKHGGYAHLLRAREKISA